MINIARPAMTTIKKDEYVFSVDIEKSKKYYETHSLCECAFCRNYYAQIKNLFPKLNKFLSEFGADISKPDEISSVETNDSINYINVDYTVCGSIEAIGQYEIDIYDNLFLSVVVTDGFACPNEQTGKYFTLSVMNIDLPWVLDEPFPKSATEKMSLKIKNIFQKLFGK